MIKFIASLILTFAAAIILSSSSAQIPVSPALAASLQNKIDNFITQYSIPGISVSLMLPGNQYWNGASGLSDIYTLSPMDTNYLFHLCSMNKLYVAAMIFQLKEQGLLNLDDSIGMYIQPAVNIPSSTTLTNLLKHRSGIADVINYPGLANIWYSYPDSIWPHQFTIQTLVDPPIFPQGQSFNYSNTNYILLGMVIEQITGNSFAHELHQRFLSPLNLTHTYFRPDDSITSPLTPGWTSFTTPNVYNTDASPIINDCSASMLFTAGSMFAPTSEVCKFTRELWSGQIISNGSLDTMKQCTNVNFGGGCDGYGYGTMRYQFNNKTYYGHAGDFNGFTQLTIHQKEDSVTLTLSVNRNGAPRGPMAAELLAIVNQVFASVDDDDVKSISIYPNPASNNIIINGIHLQSSYTLIKLSDQLGRIVPVKINNLYEESISIDVSDVDPGIYFVSIYSGKNYKTEKIIVLKQK